MCIMLSLLIVVNEEKKKTEESLPVYLIHDFYIWEFLVQIGHFFHHRDP